jgi:tRNA 2-thiouridine synthesizing protein A
VLIDGGDRSCVQLLLDLRGLAGLPAGVIVHLIATDPAAPLDLAAWCHLTGHIYLGPLPGADRPTYRLCLAALPRTTQAGSPWRLQK